MEKQVQYLRSNHPTHTLITFVKLTLAGSYNFDFSLWELADPLITLTNRVLEILKASLMLQSGHKS